MLEGARICTCIIWDDCRRPAVVRLGVTHDLKRRKVAPRLMPLLLLCRATRGLGWW